MSCDIDHPIKSSPRRHLKHTNQSMSKCWQISIQRATDSLRRARIWVHTHARLTQPPTCDEQMPQEKKRKKLRVICAKEAESCHAIRNRRDISPPSSKHTRTYSRHPIRGNSICAFPTPGIPRMIDGPPSSGRRKKTSLCFYAQMLSSACDAPLK